MDPPPVQYVTTSDGYDIAYSVSGRGQSFVYVPGQFSDLQWYWQEPLMHGPWARGLTEHFTLVRFDGRGQGMSSRGIREEQSIESLGRDLEAVVGRLRLDKFILFARWHASHIAVRYALANPGRVAAMILMICSAKNSAWPASVYRDLPGQNWNAFALSQVARDADFEEAKRRIERMNRQTTREDLAKRTEAYWASSIEDALPLISVPTLVLQPRNYMLLPARVAAFNHDARGVQQPQIRNVDWTTIESPDPNHNSYMYYLVNSESQRDAPVGEAESSEPVQPRTYYVVVHSFSDEYTMYNTQRELTELGHTVQVIDLRTR